ncbi:MAG: sigma 54-interacting transcriptional regulator [Nitrospirota bacterium]|nr:sigma 54-interacting transcriptional regulator [Nitrospirota bacterium]
MTSDTVDKALFVSTGDPEMGTVAEYLRGQGVGTLEFCSDADSALTAARAEHYPIMVMDGRFGAEACRAFCAGIHALPPSRQGLVVVVGGDAAPLLPLLGDSLDDFLPTGGPNTLLAARLTVLRRRALERARWLTAEGAIRDSGERLRAVVDTIHDGVVALDEFGTVERLNPAAERIFGYSAAEVVGQNVRMLMPEPYHSEHDGYLENYRKTGERRVIGHLREVTGRRKDGTLFPLELAVDEGIVHGRRLFTGVLRDITERKAAATRIHQSNRMLQGVTGAQAAFIAEGHPGVALRELLAHLLELTGSGYGFIGEVEPQPKGAPVLALCAAGTAENARQIDNEKLLIYADNSIIYKSFDSATPATADPAEPLLPPGTIPSDAPPLERVMVLPVVSGEEVVGMAVLGNRAQTYKKDIIESAAPLLFTAASLIQAARAETDRRQARRALEKSHADMQTVLNGLRIGTLMTDPQGVVTFMSAAARLLCTAPTRTTPATPCQSLFDCLHLEDADRARVTTTTALPEPQRAKVPVHLAAKAGGQERWMELEILDDPRNENSRIYLIYDVTDLHDLRQLLSEKNTFHELVGQSKPMRVLFQQIQDVAQVDWTVLIEGETGTGKELVARALHRASPRHNKPFIAVNAAGLTDSVLASQLFGHKRGAFTGAVEDHKGFFESAEGGTIFLDEIGDIPMGVQTSLLRVLQEREITRLGESVPRKVDVRVVAATNRDLAREVEKGAFRADLLYRLRVARVRLPPLNQRREDIPLLASFTLTRSRASSGKAVETFNPDAMRVLTTYSWPGNVRELVHAVEFAVIHARTRQIEIADLPPEITTSTPPPPSPAAPHAGIPLPQEGAVGRAPRAPRLSPEAERERILSALTACDGNRQQAARMLGVGRATLYRHMYALGIPTAK